MPDFSEIHNWAVTAATNYRRSEIELIEALENVDYHKVYRQHGYNSLFQYAIKALRLSEEVAYIFINVSRKTRDVPELKAEIKLGTLTVSKAKKITSVLTAKNKDYWLNLAKTSSKNIIEKEVAAVAPKLAVREKMVYVNPKLEVQEKVKLLRLREARVQLQLGISEDIMLKLRRAQDHLSQKRQYPVGLEEVLAVMADLYLQKNDPIKKATRHVLKNGLVPDKIETPQQVPGPVTRVPVPAHTRHQLWLKAEGQCMHIDPDQKRCSSRRFLQIHHKKPVSAGGNNHLDNLALLCAGHHQVEHLKIMAGQIERDGFQEHLS